MRRSPIGLMPVRLLAAGGLVVGLLVSCGSSQPKETKPAQPPQVSLSTISGGPRIVFRNTAIGENYGKVAMVALSDPSGSRGITDTSCDRVYAAALHILCLSSNRGVVTSYGAQV